MNYQRKSTQKRGSHKGSSHSRFRSMLSSLRRIFRPKTSLDFTRREANPDGSRKETTISYKRE